MPMNFVRRKSSLPSTPLATLRSSPSSIAPSPPPPGPHTDRPTPTSRTSKDTPAASGWGAAERTGRCQLVTRYDEPLPDKQASGPAFSPDADVEAHEMSKDGEFWVSTLHSNLRASLGLPCVRLYII